MVFNSGAFLVFFLVVYAAYAALPFRPQNWLLLAASLFFYGYWDPRFLVLLLATISVDYVAAHRIDAGRRVGRPASARNWLRLAIGSNLAVLATFKYFDFFSESFAALLEGLGFTVHPPTLRVILPLGISFYTFQSIAYTVDVYRGAARPARRFDDFALFVSFFPQLVAGPIERARSLMSQVERPREVTLENLVDGGWLVFWGLFKKVFVADNLAPYTYWAFARNGAETGLDVYLAMFAFAAQIYGDFSGYSDMARGLGRMLGFRLRRNFALPYFASNPTQLWTRWHVTLSTWFRDYVYAPLVRRSSATAWRDVAVLLTMTLVGLWHGAQWTFVFWGLSWGVVIVGYRRLQPFVHRAASGHPFARGAIEALGVFFTFHAWMWIGIFFVSTNLPNALHDQWLMLTDWSLSARTAHDARIVFFYTAPLVLVDVWQAARGRFDAVEASPLPVRFAVYTALAVLLVVGGAEHNREFIYFAF